MNECQSRLHGRGKLKYFTEKESFQFLLEGSGVDGGANVDRKTVPCLYAEQSLTELQSKMNVVGCYIIFSQTNCNIFRFFALFPTFVSHSTYRKSFDRNQ